MAQRDTVERELFSIGETAQRGGVSKGFIRKAIRDGSLRVHRLGPKVLRISKADWDAYLAKNGAKPDAS